MTVSEVKKPSSLNITFSSVLIGCKIFYFTHFHFYSRADTKRLSTPLRITVKASLAPVMGTVPATTVFLAASERVSLDHLSLSRR